MDHHYAGCFAIGIAAGFMGGLFGKGGSAVATPLLSLLGLPGFIAVASPLPATIPGTLFSSWAYRRENYLDWPVFWWSVAIGVPATAWGAYLSKATGDLPLLALTAVLVFGMGLSFLLSPNEKDGVERRESPERGAFWHLRLVLVVFGAGFFSGLLANAGGLLLAPGYARILKLPIKTAFACSLAAAMVLAIPGTLVHWRLGHIDWAAAGAIALGSVPFSYLGARVAIKARSASLERWYGLALAVLGAYFFYTLHLI